MLGITQPENESKNRTFRATETHSSKPEKTISIQTEADQSQTPTQAKTSVWERLRKHQGKIETLNAYVFFLGLVGAFYKGVR